MNAGSGSVRTDEDGVVTHSIFIDWPRFTLFVLALAFVAVLIRRAVRRRRAR